MSAMTRRELLLTLPGLAVAHRLLAQTGPGPLRVLALSQITLAVADVARSVAFYQRLFGLPIQGRQENAVLLRLGDGPYFIKIMPAGGGPARIDHWGCAVQDFDVDRVIATLQALGVSRATGGSGTGGGSSSLRVSPRDGTPEIFLADPNGLVTQLQHATYCGGGGALGATCGPVTPASAGAPLRLTGISHLTINVPDPEATNAFYRRTFGMDIQAYQAASPLLGVGPGPDFLMFIVAGGRGGGGTAAINHACFSMPGFDVARIQSALEAQGIRPRGDGQTGPLLHWVSMRMPNRGGAPEGTPELYFSDPDGLSIQLQDTSYCGGGGYLGEVC
jgi:catechol 2,3-dioxygenase-like lactoylglutathione lyase family enzyme